MKPFHRLNRFGFNFVWLIVPAAGAAFIARILVEAGLRMILDEFEKQCKKHYIYLQNTFKRPAASTAKPGSGF